MGAPTKQQKREAKMTHERFRAKYSLRDPETRQFGTPRRSKFAINVAVFNTGEAVAETIEAIAAETHGVDPRDVLCWAHTRVLTGDEWAADGDAIRRRTVPQVEPSKYRKPSVEQIAGFDRGSVFEAVRLFRLDADAFNEDAPVEALREKLTAALHGDDKTDGDESGDGDEE